MSATGRCLALAGVFALLAACATPAPEPGSIATDQRAERLLAERDWQVGGRIALNDGQDGGSGRFDWQHRDDWQSLDFSGAFGRGAWMVEGQPGDLTLRTSEGEQAASSLQQLVADYIGWPVPVDQLSYWVRGLSWPDAPSDMQRDAAGLPASLAQSGWQIEYRRWESQQGYWLPVRIDARHGEYAIKLALRGWQIGNPP